MLLLLLLLDLDLCSFLDFVRYRLRYLLLLSGLHCCYILLLLLLLYHFDLCSSLDFIRYRLKYLLLLKLMLIFSLFIFLEFKFLLIHPFPNRFNYEVILILSPLDLAIKWVKKLTVDWTIMKRYYLSLLTIPNIDTWQSYIFFLFTSL